MDFANRGSQPAQPAATGPQYSAPAAPNGKKTHKKASGGSAMRWGGGVLGLLILVLVVALIFVVSFNKGDAAYIQNGKMQAVFLQTGQVYFGKLDKNTLNGKSFVLTNIYYLQTSSTGTTAATANTNVSLVKLGCELHAPYDKMVINRDQVTFWENLQADGQVAKAVATFVKDNPNGQKCSDQSAAPNTNSSVQGAPSTTTTTPSTTTTTTPSTTTTR